MNTIIVSIERTKSGFIVTDAKSRRHKVANDLALGQLLARLTQDPTLPQVVTEDSDDTVSIITGIARRVAPQHAALFQAAEPIAQLVSSTVKKRRAAAAGGKR